MKALICILVTLPVWAQNAPAPSAQNALASQTAGPAEPASPVPSPVPSGELVLTGFVDLGYLWVTSPGGSYDTYRSIIDVHSGPKLLGTDFTLADPKHRWFDTIQVRATTWGAEPAESAHLEAKKSSVYDFNADFRDFAYYNFLPSYADPLLGQGVFLDEQSFDTRRKIAALSLDILPGHWWSPYFGWDHDSSSGTGASVFVTGENEYPVPNTLHDNTDLYRAGVRFEKPRFHVTLEEGGTAFKSDQDLYQGPGAVNFGNSPTPFFGQTLYLASLLSAYGIGGTSAYSKGYLTANPTSWLDIYGQFLYSQPNTNVHYQQANVGNFYLPSEVLFYSGEQEILTAAAEQPHTTASLGAEIRPWKHVRFVENWLTDRMHDAGSNASLDTLFLAPSGTLPLSSLIASTLVTNYSQEALDIFFDPIPKLTLRGGYRYVWGDASYAFLPPEGLVSAEHEHLRQNIGVGSITYRPAQKISVTAEAEASSSSGVYFLTSLYNYEKVRGQVHYQPLQTLSISGDFTLLNNQNPLAGTSYQYTSHLESLSLYWSPRASKVFDIQGTYTRSDLKSNIPYLEPEDLTPQVSAYRDEGHSATALFDLSWPHGKYTPKLSAGGSMFISSGSRPTSYYQPVAKLWVPLGSHVTWFTEWRYYGYGEAFFLYEGFRTHLVQTGVRLTR